MLKEDENDIDQRITALRNEMLRLPELCIERGYWWTESYKETEGEPEILRRAKALKKVLGQIPVYIEEGELIVGQATSKVRGAPVLPEFQWEWYLKEIDLISTRDWDRFAPLSEEEKNKMREFLPYWKGKTIYEKWKASLPPEYLNLHDKIEMMTATSSANMHFGHISPDHELLLNRGLEGLRKQIEAQMASLNPGNIDDFNKLQFLSAVTITLEAAVMFARRYADTARVMAGKSADSRLKAELLRIADICERVPANPARSFYEAVQSVWFVHVILMLEGWANGITLGRADQYLYPYYRKDLQAGLITVDEARELIASLYIKMNSMVTAQGSASVKFGGGFPSWPSVILGGITREGKDAVNELSYLFLEAEAEVGLSSEELIIRVNKTTPESFLVKACELTRLLRGKLKFVSDKTAIQQLLNDGKPIEYAREYIVTGCNSPTVAGMSHDLPGGMMNLPLALELALNNGVSRLTGEQLGLRTGDPRKFGSYEEVYAAYKKQVEMMIPVAILFKNLDKQLYADFAPVPFQSAFFPGCIEKGLDLTWGGTAPYLARSTSVSGAPNVGDSLAAIKKVVFEDEKVSMSRLIDALDSNFKYDAELLHLLESAPKFGNDDDYVDSIVNDVLMHAAGEVSKYKGMGGAISNIAAGTGTANIPMGFMVGALPDGRKALEPLSEGGISPHQGRNVNGPTSTMRSVAKLDHVKLSNGSVFNMRFNQDVLDDEQKIRKFAALIRTFCETGGYLVQFNIVSADILREAQRHPEKYRDLLVRVATYSAYFVELSPELQENIIARTEFQEV